MLSRIRIQVICTVAEKISKSNIFSVEIPILGGKKKKDQVMFLLFILATKAAQAL